MCSDTLLEWRVLVRPADEQLNAYCAALSTGWSADNLRPIAAQELAEIAQPAALDLDGRVLRQHRLALATWY